MPRTQRPSRFSPAYLASRHAGAFFFFLALGIFAGVAWRALAQATRYQSAASFSVTLPASADVRSFDWKARGEQYRGILENRDSAELLTANLRHAAKLAATRGMRLDTEELRTELSRFKPSRRYSTLLLDRELATEWGPAIEITLRDIAANLDFQSLAVIISDLDPPVGVESWDFSFFQPTISVDSHSFIISRLDANEPFFRVFHKLHEILHPESGQTTPEETWRTAVDELAARLAREAEFDGGGGFGHQAQRELMREFAALPALAASGLYGAVNWRQGDGNFQEQHDDWLERWRRDAFVRLDRQGETTGRLEAGMDMNLNPIAFPRDTVLTRLPPLAVMVLLEYINDREKDASIVFRQADKKESVVSVVANDTPPEIPELMAQTRPIDAEFQRKSARLRAEAVEVEKTLRQAKLDREAALRRLEAAGDAGKQLTALALSAHGRTDRLRERRDELAAELEKSEASVSLELTRLCLARDAVLERLASLLQNCTEEHPFVRQARRELAGLEELIAAHASESDGISESRPENIRLAVLQEELDTAAAAAATHEERLRRHNRAVETELGLVASLERNIADCEEKLARIGRELAEPPQSVAVAVAIAPKPPVPSPAVAPETQNFSTLPAPLLGQPPARAPLRAIRPSYDAIATGSLLGAALGLLAILLRELLTFRFANAYEAERLVPYQLLASLPAYDPASFRKAATGLKGMTVVSRRGVSEFIPDPVEISEPPPATRRGKLTPARRRPKFLAWTGAFLLLACAILLHLTAQNSLSRVPVPFEGELSLPQAVYVPPESTLDNLSAEGSLP